MAHPGQAYTLTIWNVKAGQEEEFVHRWSDLADWTALQGLSGRARLLRDHDDRRRFISFGPWETVAMAQRWKSMEGFRERILRLQAVVEGLEPHILEVVLER
jgi:heme-degrading monooxygenase HmoA